ncbi:MAG: pilus assembly protein TadG-related protein [Terracidiphilus sp.]
MMTFYALLLPVIILFCGLTLDVANLELTKMQMQSAADAAALGAQVAHDREDTAWVADGIADAGTNGFTNGVNGVVVTIAEQPSAGVYAGDYDAIQVTITKPVSMYIMRIAGVSNLTVMAQAASVMTPCSYFTGARSLTTYALNLSTGSSIGRWGGSTMGCSIYVGTGMKADTNSSVWTNAENVVGSAASSLLSGGLFHAPHYGANAYSDPLSSITQPVFSSCNHPAGTGVTAGTASVHITANGSYTLNPGTYCGGLNFSGGGTFTLNSGLYIICGGANWNGVHVNGTGVTLFFTQKGDNVYGQFIVTMGTYTLSAPGNGGSGIPKIVVFGDRNWVNTSASGQDFQFLSGVYTGDGIYYTTRTGIEVLGSTFSGTNYFGFDTDNMLIVSSAVSPLGNYSSFSDGNPFRPLGGVVE